MDLGTGVAVGCLALSVVTTVGLASWNVSAKLAALTTIVRRIEKPNGFRFPECAVHEEQLQEHARRLEALE